MKDLSEADFVLGIKITRDCKKRMLGLSQSQYNENVLNKFHISNAKPPQLPISFQTSSCSGLQNEKLRPIQNFGEAFRNYISGKL